MSPVSVALPIHRLPAELDPGSGRPPIRAIDRFQHALASIRAQTHSDLEILIILNGADQPARDAAIDAARRDTRVRILERPEAGLSEALNFALAVASHDFVARMDADDFSAPDRIAAQVAEFSQRRDLAALGTSWEQAEPDGTIRAIINPPPTPQETRWHLLADNPFAHGSMILRRRAILAAGGYDPARPRAQDYDLWLRLSHHAAIAGMLSLRTAAPLYRYSLPPASARAGRSSSELQARHAAELVAAARANLPAANPADSDAILTASHARDPAAIAAALQTLGAIMTARGPTQQLLNAWLALRDATPAIDDASQSARVRQFARDLQRSGVCDLFLWGAGAHTSRILPVLRTCGLRIAGLIDDHCSAAERFGLPIQRPAALAPGQHVLLSSDAHEDALARSAAPCAARGVIVHRLYAA